LLPEEYGIIFEYLSGKKNVSTVADALSRLDIDSLMIQDIKEETINLISRLEKGSISNIKSIIQIHTALIFKEKKSKY
jgi:hypothetical protein